MFRKKHVPVWIAIVALSGAFLVGQDAWPPAAPFTLVNSITVDGGTNGNDEPRSILHDGNGTLYVTGYVTVPSEGENIWLARMDANLDIQTSTTLNGPGNGDDAGYSIALDGTGNVYVVGYVSQTGQNHDIWIARFDADLGLVHQVMINGSENDSDDAYGIVYDGLGNLYVSGTLRETGEGANIWIGKYDTDLNLQTSTTLNGPVNDTDKARFLALDGEGNLFVSGSVTQAGTDYDIWLGKFDTGLNLLDETIVAGPTSEEDKGYGLVYDGAGTLYVTGTIIEPGQSYNSWLAKYDTDLGLLKSDTLDGPVSGEDVSYTIALDGSGHLYQTGVYSEATGGANVWVARYDTNLDLQAYTTYNGPGNGYDTGIGLARGLGQDLYVSASITQTSGDLDIWIARYAVSP